MDRSRGPSLASPLSPGGRPEGAKLRKKLQKGGPKQRNYLTKRPGSGGSNEGGLDGKGQGHGARDAPVGRAQPAQHQQQQQRQQQHQQPSLPLPPDLSDSKWLEYIRRSGFLSPMDSSAQSKESLQIPMTSIIPEFAHLKVNDAKPRDTLQKLASTDSPNSSTSTMRRRAKTPILHIGQLEGVAHATQTADLTINDTKTSAVEHNVEQIAEQYRALLQSRNSMLFDSHSEPPPSRQEESDGVEGVTRANSSEEIRTAELQFLEVQPPDFPTGSPASDGTLVGFEEERVYFKPVSFSPEPLSPIRDEDLSLPSPPPAVLSAHQYQQRRHQNNLSLQICLDLLVRELTPVLGDRSFRSSADASALQIWVMIEAYEKLRDHAFDLPLRPEERGPMEAMLDVWLRALYSIHDRLAVPGLSARGSDSSDYEALESEDLD